MNDFIQILESNGVPWEDVVLEFPNEVLNLASSGAAVPLADAISANHEDLGWFSDSGDPQTVLLQINSFAADFESDPPIESTDDVPEGRGNLYYTDNRVATSPAVDNIENMQDLTGLFENALL